MTRSRLGPWGLALGLLWSAQAARAVTIDVVPSAATVPPGSSLTIDVVVSGLGNFASPSVGGFDLDLTFDDSLFAFTGIVFGPFLGDPTMGEASTMSSVVGGTLSADELSLLPAASLDALQPDSFILFSATFDAIAVGTGTFDVDVLTSTVSDELAAALPIDAVAPASVVTGTVIDIPTLSQWGLILLVLLLLAGGLARLRRATS